MNMKEKIEAAASRVAAEQPISATADFKPEGKNRFKDILAALSVKPMRVVDFGGWALAVVELGDLPQHGDVKNRLAKAGYTGWKQIGTCAAPFSSDTKTFPIIRTTNEDDSLLVIDFANGFLTLNYAA